MTCLLFGSLLALLSSQVAWAWVASPHCASVRQESRRTRCGLGARGADDFFGLYNDEELWGVLNIHRQLTDQQSSSEFMEASFTTDASIHESVMKSYGEDTMQNLLHLHESLKQVADDEESFQRLQTLRQSLSSPKKDGTTIPPSLHSLVQEAVGTIETPGISDVTAATPMRWDDTTLEKIAGIRSIACDVDGTLLTSQHTLHPRSRQAVRRAVLGLRRLFFLATGKSRKGALGSLGVEMAALLENAPGVFLQGLYCVDGEGNVVFEQKLTNSAVAAVEQLAKECKVSVVAYDGDKLYSPELTESVIELTERYGEPKVAPLMTSLAAYEPGIHKILLMHENVEMLRRIRPQLEALAKENNACVTQAVPTMLEWMPGGCSKANGVSKLCEALGIDPSTELLAIGDAENDVGMLEMAAIGVAVGNACPRAQEAADFWMEETNDDGGAGSAMELFGFGLDE